MSIVSGYNPRLNYPAINNITINIYKGPEKHRDHDDRNHDCGCDESGKGKGKGLLGALFGKGKGKAKDKDCGCKSGCSCHAKSRDAGPCGSQIAQGPQQMMAQMLGMMASMMQQMGTAGGGSSCYGVGSQMGGFRHPGFGV